MAETELKKPDQQEEKEDDKMDETPSDVPAKPVSEPNGSSLPSICHSKSTEITEAMKDLASEVVPNNKSDSPKKVSTGPRP